METIKRKSKQLVTFSHSSWAVLILTLEILAGIGIVSSCLIIFFKLADRIIDRDKIFFDQPLMQFFYLHRSPVLTSIMTFFSFFGGELFLGVAIILTILLLLPHHRRRPTIFGFILLFGILLNLLLKQLFARPRPTFHPLVHETTFSFPSGHAMNSTVFYIALTYFIFLNLRNTTVKIVLSVLAGILLLMIGISRIYLGAHYPSDVVAGYGAGIAWFGIVLLFEKTLIFFKLFGKYKPNKDVHAILD